MATKSLEQRIADLKKKQEQLKAQEKMLKTKQSQKARKERTKRLIEVGAVLEKACGMEFTTKEDRERLLSILTEENGQPLYVDEFGEPVFSSIAKDIFYEFNPPADEDEDEDEYENEYDSDDFDNQNPDDFDGPEYDTSNTGFSEYDFGDMAQEIIMRTHLPKVAEK